MIFRIIVGLYLAILPFSVTGMIANLDYECEHGWPYKCDSRQARSDTFLGAAIGLAIPVSFVVTSGWRDGFRLYVRPSSLNGGPTR